MVHTTSSPSSTNQTGVTCGLPSALVTPSFPVRVPVITNARHSSSVILGMPGQPSSSPQFFPDYGYPDAGRLAQAGPSRGRGPVPIVG